MITVIWWQPVQLDFSLTAVMLTHMIQGDEEQYLVGILLAAGCVVLAYYTTVYALILDRYQLLLACVFVLYLSSSVRDALHLYVLQVRFDFYKSRYTVNNLPHLNEIVHVNAMPVVS
ncbi:MAG: hypothetical protein K0U13_01160 [Chlamydiae bacterium]|nr:hypothetical protein [Chlamydiota bacterium]